MTAADSATLSVLVLPSGAVGQRVREIVDGWYATGLLRTALWVHPEDVSAEFGGAPRVTAALRSPQGSEEGDLFSLLGHRRLDLVRVVMVQVVHDAHAFDELQIEAAATVRDSVVESLPGTRRDPDGEATVGTKVRRINLITGATGLAEVTPEVVPSGWDIAAVTSPEDRPDPSRANAFVRADSAEPNLLPVAVLSAAVVAAVIPGPPDGPFDRNEGDESTVLGKARVIRSTVRVLLGERAVREVALEARQRALTPESQGVIDPDRFGVVARPQDLVGDVLSWLDTVDGATAVPSASASADSVRREVTIRHGIQTFAAFAGRALWAMIWALWSLLRRGTESMATRAIVGERAGVNLVIRPDVATKMAGDLSDIEEEDLRFWTEILEKVERRPVRMPTHELWSQLREVAHDLLDGGSTPHGTPRPMEGSRPLLLSTVTDVVPHPEDGFTLPDDLPLETGAQEVPACSPGVARAAQRHLVEARERAEESVASAKNALGAATSAPPSGQAHDQSRADGIERARRTLAEAHEAFGRMKQLEQDFRQWLEQRSGALVWSFRERNLERLHAASTGEEQSRHLVGVASGLDRDDLDRRRRTFLLRAWGTVLVTAILLALSMLTADRRELGVVREMSLIALVGAVVLLLFIRAWYQGVLAYLYAFEQAARARARAAAEFEIQHADRRRFEAMEAGLDEWADVLGWSLHTPWAGDEEGPDAATASDLSAVPLPAALRLGEPALDERSADAAARTAARRFTDPAWRGRAYRRLVACHAGDPNEGEAAADADRMDSDQAHRDRDEFRQALASGRPQAEAAPLVSAEIERILRRERLCVDRLTVRDAGGAASQELVSDEAFLAQALVPASHLATETWSDKALSQGAHELLQTRCWARRAVACSAPRGGSLTTIPDDELTDSALLDVVVRVDVSPWLDLSELRLFGRAPSQDELRWQSSGNDDIYG